MVSPVSPSCSNPSCYFLGVCWCPAYPSILSHSVYMVSPVSPSCSNPSCYILVVCWCPACPSILSHSVYMVSPVSPWVLTHLAASWGSVGVQLAHLSCPILSTWSLQFRLRVLTHLATSIALPSSLLIRSLKVTLLYFLKLSFLRTLTVVSSWKSRLHKSVWEAYRFCKFLFWIRLTYMRSAKWTPAGKQILVSPYLLGFVLLVSFSIKKLTLFLYSVIICVLHKHTYFSKEHNSVDLCGGIDMCSPLFMNYIT
jgi:hypothetical protein